jgi:CheY-like chemotaxis protein
MKEENVILLVEDCAEDASLALYAFKKWGIPNPVRVIPDGEQALEYLAGKGKYADRERHPLPCLALLDLKLPQLPGLEVLQWIRARRELDSLPVIVLSGTRQPEEFEQAHRLGANGCVNKTNDLNELYDLIQHLNYFSAASEYNNSAVEFFPES